MAPPTSATLAATLGSRLAGIQPASAATPDRLAAAAAYASSCASPASRSYRPACSSRSRSGRSADRAGADEACPACCSRAAASPGGVCSLSVRSISTAAASATRASTSRSAPSGATRAIRVIRTGATASSHRIVSLQRPAAASGDLQRGADPPGVGRHHGHGAEDGPLSRPEVRSSRNPSRSTLAHQAASARHRSPGELIPARTHRARAGSHGPAHQP